MCFLPLIHIGIRNLSNLFTQAIACVDEINREIKQNIGVNNRHQIIEALEENLRDLSENGSFYARVKPRFDYTRYNQNHDNYIIVRATYSVPRKDKPKEAVVGCAQNFSISCASWKLLERDLKYFAEGYTDLYMRAYSDDKTEVEKKVKRLEKIFAPYLRRAEESIAIENISQNREPR